MQEHIKHAPIDASPSADIFKRLQGFFGALHPHKDEPWDWESSFRMMGTSDADLCMEYAGGEGSPWWVGGRWGFGGGGGSIVYFDSLACDGGPWGLPWRRASFD